MIGIVGDLLRQFGPSTAGTNPNVPTFTVIDNRDGTVTVTISGSSVGSTNTVYAQTQFGLSFVSEASRTGDGAITFPLSAGRYFVYVNSTLTGLTADSLVSPLFVLGTAGLPLVHSPAFIVRCLLVQMNLATDPSINQAWPAFASREPDLPDSCITCYNSPGKVEGQTNTDNEVQEHYGVQIRFRAATPDVCYTKIKSVLNLLDETVLLVEVDIVDGNGTTKYLINAIARTGGIVDMGNEVASSKRTIMAVNTIVSLIRLS